MTSDCQLVPEWEQLAIPVEDYEPEDAQPEHTQGDEDGS